MQNYDNDILLQNIKKLMTDNGITQAALADILGMSQSNVSKALSSNDKKNFTLDQLAAREAARIYRALASEAGSGPEHLEGQEAGK